jgi:hypothetical protein
MYFIVIRPGRTQGDALPHSPFFAVVRFLPSWYDMSQIVYHINIYKSSKFWYKTRGSPNLLIRLMYWGSNYMSLKSIPVSIRIIFQIESALVETDSGTSRTLS